MSRRTSCGKRASSASRALGSNGRSTMATLGALQGNEGLIELGRIFAKRLHIDLGLHQGVDRDAVVRRLFQPRPAQLVDLVLGGIEAIPRLFDFAPCVDVIAVS